MRCVFDFTGLFPGLDSCRSFLLNDILDPKHDPPPMPSKKKSKLLLITFSFVTSLKYFPYPNAHFEYGKTFPEIIRTQGISTLVVWRNRIRQKPISRLMYVNWNYYLYYYTDNFHRPVKNNFYNLIFKINRLFKQVAYRPEFSIW